MAPIIMDWQAAADAFKRPPKLTPEQEVGLVAAWLSCDPVGERQFVDAFRLFLRAEVWWRWPRSWKRVDDLEQDAFVRLIEMRQTEEGRAKTTPPLWKLAKETMRRPVRILRREKEHLPLEGHDVPIDGNQEQSLLLRELLEEASKLPRGGARTLLAHAGHVAGQGPDVAEALGVNAESAHMRLVRAQAAVMRKIEGNEADDD